MATISRKNKFGQIHSAEEAMENARSPTPYRERIKQGREAFETRTKAAIARKRATRGSRDR